MKHFVISDDSNFIYCSNPRDVYGNLICLPLAVSQENVKGWFNEQYTSLSCENSTSKTAMVFEKVLY